MSPIKISLTAALLSMIVTAGGLYYVQQARAQEAGELQRQNDRMRAEASRRHLAAAAASATQVAPVLSASAATGDATLRAISAPDPAPTPTEYYRDEGNASPLATLQTFAWACDRGDTATVRRLLYIDAAARPKVEAYRASLPPAARAQWANADEMAATVLTRSVMERPFPNADILETATIEPLTPDRIRLRLPDVPRDGTEYQKTGDGWSYVLTEKVVDDYLRRMKEASAPAVR